MGPIAGSIAVGVRLGGGGRRRENGWPGPQQREGGPAPAGRGASGRQCGRKRCIQQPGARSGLRRSGPGSGGSSPAQLALQIRTEQSGGLPRRPASRLGWPACTSVTGAVSAEAGRRGSGGRFWGQEASQPLDRGRRKPSAAEAAPWPAQRETRGTAASAGLQEPRPAELGAAQPRPLPAAATNPCRGAGQQRAGVGPHLAPTACHSAAACHLRGPRC